MDAPAAFRTLILSWNGITWDFSRRWRSEGSWRSPWVRHFHAWICALEVLVGKRNACFAWFAATTRVFISLRDAYRDLCRRWQFGASLDDRWCVFAWELLYVQPFDMQLHRCTFDSNLTFCSRFNYTSTYFCAVFVQNVACFFKKISGPGRNAALQFLLEALWYSGTSSSKTARL